MATKKSPLSPRSLLPPHTQLPTKYPVKSLPVTRHTSINMDDPYCWWTRKDLTPTPLINRSNKSNRSCWLWLEDRLCCFCLECTIVILTFLNVLLITTELLINLRIITVPSTTSSSVHNEDLFPSHDDNRTSVSTPAGGATSPLAPHDNQLPPVLRTAELVCHYLSISIVSFFLFEISVKLLIKNKEFLQDRWQILDAVVVIVSFCIELLITLTQPLPVYWELATFVMVLRLWRLGRMCNRKSGNWRREGEIEVFQTGESTRKENDHFRKLQYKLDKQEKEIKRLESMLRRYQQDNNIDSNRNNTENLLEILESKNQYDRHTESKSDTIIATEEVTQIKPNEPTNGQLPNSQPIERQDSQDSRDSYDQSESETHLHYSNTPQFSRADSESSMSQDGGLAATIHNVQVDVEGGSENSQRNNMRTRGSTDGETEEGPCGYTNQSFETDISLDDRNWPILSEIDGTKTYRSADGIPMTSL